VGGGLFSAGAIGDFNDDGILDTAGAVEGEPRLVVHLAGEPGWFSPMLVETGAPVVALRTGDFDGDGVTDLAAAETYPDGDRVSIFYGSTSGPYGEAVPMAGVERFLGMDTGTLLLPGITGDVTDDLVLRASATGAVGEPVGVYLLMGNAVRLMASAYDMGVEIRAIFTGRFTTDGDEAYDVLAVTAPAPTGESFQLVPGTGGARFRTADRRHLAAAPVDDGSFDPTCARFAAGDLDGDGHDDVVGLGSCAGGPRLLVGHVSGDAAAPVLDATAIAFGDVADPSWIALEDVDGDGARDLVAISAAGLTVHWNEGGELDAGRRAVLPGAWLGVALVGADDDPARELVVGDAGGLRLVEVVGRELQAAPDPVIAGGGRPWTGDLDGDGLDDLLVARAGRVDVYRALPHDQAGTP
jgi:hypothetical protein